MKITIRFLLCFLLLGCNLKKANKTSTISNKKEVLSGRNLPSDSTFNYASKASSLPLGKEEILLDNIKDKANYEYLKKINIFKYYDTVGGIASVIFKTIDIPKYNSLYKPIKSDVAVKDDSRILKSIKDYDYFRLVKILPKKSNNEILIFEGISITSDYDGNEIITNRKDLVIYDSKNNKIIDEMNLYYDYSDGIVAVTKLFFIDQKYNIYIRCFSENEEGDYNVSKLNQFSISSKGIILIN